MLFRSKEGIDVAVEGTANRSRAIVEKFRALKGLDRGCLHRLCVWLAPSLYTVGKESEEGNSIFAGTEPLDREHVSFSTDMGGPDNRVAHVGECTLIMMTQ